MLWCVGIEGFELVDENKDVEGCRRDGRGGLSWVVAGHQSASVGLEWLPPSFEHQILKRTDPGENDVGSLFVS